MDIFMGKPIGRTLFLKFSSEIKVAVLIVHVHNTGITGDFEKK